MFLDLCNDKIWGVRKAAAVALPDMSKACKEENRSSDMMQAFNHLNEDVSRWVRNALMESLGPFIASFIGDPLVCGLSDILSSAMPVDPFLPLTGSISFDRCLREACSGRSRFGPCLRL